MPRAPSDTHLGPPKAQTLRLRGSGTQFQLDVAAQCAQSSCQAKVVANVVTDLRVIQKVEWPERQTVMARISWQRCTREDELRRQSPRRVPVG